MSRSSRLFELMQVLRRYRGSVSGKELAEQTGVSIRTIYRDIATLQSMGADIEGEPGVGYILRPGFLLPPLSFTEEEIHAIAAGAMWVSRQTDDGLALAAENALAKIKSVLPAEIRPELESDSIYVGHRKADESPIDLRLFREAMRGQYKMAIIYSDQDGAQTERIIWPVMLGFVDSKRFIAGWCELREGFRLFRIDRIKKVAIKEDRYSTSRRHLVKEWRKEISNKDKLPRAQRQK